MPCAAPLPCCRSTPRETLCTPPPAQLPSMTASSTQQQVRFFSKCNQPCTPPGCTCCVKYATFTYGCHCCCKCHTHTAAPTPYIEPKKLYTYAQLLLHSSDCAASVDADCQGNVKTGTVTLQFVQAVVAKPDQFFYYASPVTFPASAGLLQNDVVPGTCAETTPTFAVVTPPTSGSVVVRGTALWSIHSAILCIAANACREHKPHAHRHLACCSFGNAIVQCRQNNAWCQKVHGRCHVALHAAGLHTP